MKKNAPAPRAKDRERITDDRTFSGVKFSVDVDLDGQKMHLVSSDLGELRKQPLDEAMKSLSFRMGPRENVRIELNRLTNWLAKKGFSLPPGIDRLLDDEVVTISDAMIDGRGAYALHLDVAFKHGLLGSFTNKLVHLGDMGLDIVHRESDSLESAADSVIHSLISDW